MTYNRQSGTIYHVRKIQQQTHRKVKVVYMRDNFYRMKTTEELISMYAFENTRINDSDRIQTQKSIKRELRARFESTIKLLDDDQTTQNPKGTFNYLLNI